MTSDFTLTSDELCKARVAVGWAEEKIESAQRSIRIQQGKAGRAMRDVRVLAGMSDEEMAAVIGVPLAQLDAMEQGFEFYGWDKALVALDHLERRQR